MLCSAEGVKHAKIRLGPTPVHRLCSEGDSYLSASDRPVLLTTRELGTEPDVEPRSPSGSKCGNHITRHTAILCIHMAAVHSQISHTGRVFKLLGGGVAPTGVDSASLLLSGTRDRRHARATARLICSVNKRERWHRSTD